MIVALPALRTRGVNLAVATLALSLMINAVIFNNGALTGGFVGTVVESPSFFGLGIDPIEHPDRYGTFVLVMLVVSGLVVANVRRGRSGRRLMAVRGNERAAASLGINVYGAKLYAFGLASGLAGLGGVLIGFHSQNVQFANLFDVSGSIAVVLYAVLGGVGWGAGAVLGGLQTSGGVINRGLNEMFKSVDTIAFYLYIVSGAGVIGILRQSPDGLAALQARALRPLLDRIPRIRAERKPESPDPPRNPPPAELSVSKITVTFGGVVALDDVSFSVHPGEIVGLIGPNGAGKTTMLDVITGFTKQTSGTVTLDAYRVDGRSPERRARAGIARSWQAVELFEEMTVRENLLVAADRHDTGRYFRDLIRPGRQGPTAIMESILDEFELHSHLGQRPSSLPQGTARLVGIARAMVTEPSVLLLDEPAAGLDAVESRELGVAIRNISNQYGIGILMVEHDVSLLLSICDRIVVLDFGRLIAEGTPDEVTRDPEVIRAYLGKAGEGDGTSKPGTDTLVTSIKGRS